MIIKATIDGQAIFFVVCLSAPALVAEADLAGVFLGIDLLSGVVGRVVELAGVELFQFGVALGLAGAAGVEVFVQHFAVLTLLLKARPVAT